MYQGKKEHFRLPYPFYDDAWPKACKSAAEALWQWHLHLLEPVVLEAERGDLAVFFVEEATHAARGEPIRVLPKAIAEAAYAACEEYHLDRALLAEQVRAAALFCAPIRFQTSAALERFIEQWANSHGRLLAALAGLGHSWQQPAVDDLARAFFLTGRLAALPEDLALDRLFIPLDEMAAAGVAVEQLQSGPPDDAVRKVLWKQNVRARDAFAQGQALARDLSGRRLRAFKRWWLGGLALLHEMERRDFDVWSTPLRLSKLQQVRVHVQALVGKTAFR